MCGVDVAGDVDTWAICRTCCHQTRVAQVAQAVPLQTVDAIRTSAMESIHRGILTRSSGEFRFSLRVVIQYCDDLIMCDGRGSAAHMLRDALREEVFQEFALGA